jgi:hypothetical protein
MNLLLYRTLWTASDGSSGSGCQTGVLPMIVWAGWNMVVPATTGTETVAVARATAMSKLIDRII